MRSLRVRLQDCKRKPAVARLIHSAPIGHRTPGPSGDNDIYATPTNRFGGSYAPFDRNLFIIFMITLLPVNSELLSFSIILVIITVSAAGNPE